MANPAIHKNQALMRKDPAKHIVIFVDEALTDASLDVVWMMQTACFLMSLMNQKHRSDSLQLCVDNQSVAWFFLVHILIQSGSRRALMTHQDDDCSI